MPAEKNTVVAADDFRVRGFSASCYERPGATTFSDGEQVGGVGYLLSLHIDPTSMADLVPMNPPFGYK
jgi:hypothetical protein